MNKLVLTGLLAAGTMTHLQGAQPAGQRPNILFILSDDHTSQAWGIYGGILAEYAHNANIRRLANEGVVLDNCFCTNSISAPSRASILTGLYSHRNGLYTLADSLDTSIPPLPPCCKPTDTTPDSSANGISSRNRKDSTTTPSSTIKANTVTRLS